MDGVASLVKRAAFSFLNTKPKSTNAAETRGATLAVKDCAELQRRQ
jgi:hypothetical protein